MASLQMNKLPWWGQLLVFTFVGAAIVGRVVVLADVLELVLDVVVDSHRAPDGGQRFILRLRLITRRHKWCNLANQPRPGRLQPADHMVCLPECQVRLAGADAQG